MLIHVHFFGLQVVRKLVTSLCSCTHMAVVSQAKFQVKFTLICVNSYNLSLQQPAISVPVSSTCPFPTEQEPRLVMPLNPLAFHVVLELTPRQIGTWHWGILALLPLVALSRNWVLITTDKTNPIFLNVYFEKWPDTRYGLFQLRALLNRKY